MATATEEQPASVLSQYMPADIAAHEADKARRAADRAKKAPLLDKCLDAEFASREEARKPLYEFEVSTSFSRKMPDSRGVERMTPLSFTEKIIAQTESDAWSLFCDKIGHYPSPAKANRVIKQLKKISN